MVAGFVQSAPNETLMQAAAREWRASARLVDIGCGAGRNAIPLAQSGWPVIGTDLSRPMLNAAMARVKEHGLAERVQLVLAPMDRLPVASDSCDFVAAIPLRELNRPQGTVRTAGPPVIFEALFRRTRD